MIKLTQDDFNKARSLISEQRVKGGSIQAKIRIIAPIKVQIIIRKMEVDNDGIFRAKYGLSKTGEWVKVDEGMRYPDECLFEAEAAYEPISYPPIDIFTTLDDIHIVASTLDNIERQGEFTDTPEGVRYAKVSDTLLKQLADKLWRLIWPSKTE